MADAAKFLGVDIANISAILGVSCADVNTILGLTVPHGMTITYGFFIGGYSTGYLQDCDRLDVGANSWASQTDMPSPARDSGMVMSIDSYVYYAYGSDGSALQDCDEWSGSAWTAKTNAPASARRVGCSSIGSPDDNLGYTFAGYGDQAGCEEFSKSGNSWASKTDIASGGGYGMGGMGDPLGSGNFYIALGYLSSQVCQSFNVAGNSWATETSATAQGANGVAGMQTDTYGYVVGGNCGSGCGEGRNENRQYDPSGDSWAAKAVYGGGDIWSVGGVRGGGTDMHMAYGYLESCGATQACYAFSEPGNSWEAKTSGPAPARYGNGPGAGYS